MKRITRRRWLQRSLAGGLALGLPSLVLGEPLSRAVGPNAEVRVGVIGLGGIDTVGGVGGRGRQLIERLRQVPGTRVVALCDVDREVLDHELRPFKDRREEVRVYRDLRKLFDDPQIDAVAIATPNHWHALATIWACEAGKDVYVEKPFSYNLWEGRQMVAAARKHGRMVQVGTQSRSSLVLPQVFEFIRRGEIGAIRCARAIVYRAREGIGRVGAPLPPPSTVDYDLWCGPAPKAPLARKQLHYDWHWFWSTGNGEIGNNGVHSLDVCRWALGQNGPPPRAMSIGGRFAFADDGQTPNTHIAILDYRPAPILCEIRNLHAAKAADSPGKFRGIRQGVVIDCEGGCFAGDSSGGTVFDHEGRKVKEFQDPRKPHEFAISISHLANFAAAVRSRRAGDLNAEAREGHFSAACAHMANISYRLGRQSPPGAVLETIRANGELSDAFERCREHLKSNGVDLAAEQAVLGPWVTLDAAQERFVGEHADRANELSQRTYRAPFTVPRV